MGVIRILLSGELWKLRKYRIWKNFLSDYKKNPLHMLRTFAIHRRGFTLSDWELQGLSKDNYKTYLTSRAYSGMHPINGYYSKIIDDKMVIKYVFSGTPVGKYMPDYYYLIDEQGVIRPMMDAGGLSRNPAVDDVVALLKENGKLALKLITGSIGKGFYKAEYKDGEFYVNDKQMSRDDFETFVGSLRNYIVSEYLTTHPYLSTFWPDTANTLRYLVGSVNGEWRLIKSYIRFGSKKSGVVENFNAGGVLSYIDENGHFRGGYVMGKKGRQSYSVAIDRHPDTNQVLDGDIPCWDEIRKCAEGIEKLLPQTKYLGFDFVVTDKDQVKLLEINSLTSLDTIQLDCSILDTENGKWFFEHEQAAGHGGKERA